MKNRLKAFTLVELLVVMGIIVLFIALSIPAVRAMTGSSSNSVARNELSALVTRAREEAVALQSVRGVLFFIDPTSDRVVGVICQQAGLQDPNLSNNFNITLLDAVPSRDVLWLPPGVRLQTVYNGTPSTSSATTGYDRYLGFNPENGVKIGGCILFDGNGRLIVKPYGFQMSQISGTSTAISTLGKMLYGQNATPSSLSGTITYTVPSTSITSYAYVLSVTGPTEPASIPNLPVSQLGMVLFDYDTFQSQGFNDIDAVPNNQGYTSASLTVGTFTQTQSEQTEETWIDSNSTPIMINRYDGTLIRGE